MTITNKVQGAYFGNESEETDLKLIRLAPNAPPSKGPTRRQGKPWSHEEHEKFLEAMEKYPSGPWKRIATHVGTRSTRQTMTHAQKYRQKIARWKRTNQASAFASNLPRSPSEITDSENTESAADDDLLRSAAGFWQSIMALEVDFSDEEQQCVTGLQTEILDEEQLLPDFAASLLEGYEPLQLAQDIEMAQIDEKLAELL